MSSQREWPRGQEDGSERGGPLGCFIRAEGKLRSNRDVAGPLRMGTEPRVGPKGAIEANYSRESDFGMDRISPQRFDPIGTERNRFGDIDSKLIAREIRSKSY